MASVVRLTGPPADERESAAIQTALCAAFAAQEMRVLGNGCLQAAVAPSLLLWIHARWLLPATIVWLAHVAWSGTIGLAFFFAMAGRRAVARLEAVRPSAERAARLHFGPSEPAPPVSARLASLALAVSAVLWAHALVPRLPAPRVLYAARAGWAPLTLAAAAARRRELQRA
jgi:hypothetical protein